jgi:hypothetical protein
MMMKMGLWIVGIVFYSTEFSTTNVMDILGWESSGRAISIL